MNPIEGVVAPLTTGNPRPVAVLAATFVGAAAASNWAIQHVGHYNGAHAPRTIPIGWGMEAASGVILVGVMISVRDALHEQVGIKGTLLAILIGSAISSSLAPPALAVASGATMVLAESADALVYQSLRRRGRVLAEASGGVNIKTVRGIAETGVDFISVGALTHSARAVDIGLDFEM